MDWTTTTISIPALKVLTNDFLLIGDSVSATVPEETQKLTISWLDMTGVSMAGLHTVGQGKTRLDMVLLDMAWLDMARQTGFKKRVTILVDGLAKLAWDR